ncbi:hypothetical protein GCM10027435_19530 [Haloparvum alkalitolerans]
MLDTEVVERPDERRRVCLAHTHTFGPRYKDVRSAAVRVGTEGTATPTAVLHKWRRNAVRKPHDAQNPLEKDDG